MNANESNRMSILEMLTTCLFHNTQVFFIYFNQICIQFNSVHCNISTRRYYCYHYY